MHIVPLGDRVLLKRKEETETTEGGIIIPPTAQEKQLIGEVVAVGEGHWRDGKFEPLAVSIGDSVLIGKYAGSEVDIDGEKHLMMRESEILGIVVE